jgi:hypothetical protein
VNTTARSKMQLLKLLIRIMLNISSILGCKFIFFNL